MFVCFGCFVRGVCYFGCVSFVVWGIGLICVVLFFGGVGFCFGCVCVCCDFFGLFVLVYVECYGCCGGSVGVVGLFLGFLFWGKFVCKFGLVICFGGVGSVFGFYFDCVGGYVGYYNFGFVVFCGFYNWSVFVLIGCICDLVVLVFCDFRWFDCCLWFYLVWIFFGLFDVL